MVKAQAMGWFISQRTNSALQNARKLGLISAHRMNNVRYKPSPLNYPAYQRM